MSDPSFDQDQTIAALIAKWLDQLETDSFIVERDGAVLVVRHSDAMHALLHVRSALRAVPPQQEEIADELTHRVKRHGSFSETQPCDEIFAHHPESWCDGCLMRRAASALRAVRSPQQEAQHEQKATRVDGE